MKVDITSIFTCLRQGYEEYQPGEPIDPPAQVHAAGESALSNPELASHYPLNHPACCETASVHQLLLPTCPNTEAPGRTTGHH